MIVANWPDRCPECGCREFLASSEEKPQLIDVPAARRTRKPFKQGHIRFECRDVGCSHDWEVDLTSVDPIVFVHEKIEPMAVVAPQGDADVIMALDDEWRSFPLSHLVGRGAERAKLVALSAKAVSASKDG